ncbi:hypothetical protein OGAPHI_002686 [Ogataea philodendri]|uniref:Uncharacterized protein n=1 Tax=Ogataea philodendri TaxID=1378263 RepID=A0A9P8T8E9_9ASCO|nr:uncharacterized protein OGAPHI_002686 [Ogataea philodendri]KAH3668931.1 hypothetical protein OGAPHI_002686 [Ogataea philodendri]
MNVVPFGGFVSGDTQRRPAQISAVGECPYLGNEKPYEVSVGVVANVVVKPDAMVVEQLDTPAAQGTVFAAGGLGHETRATVCREEEQVVVRKHGRGGGARVDQHSHGKCVVCEQDRGDD